MFFAEERTVEFSKAIEQKIEVKSTPISVKKFELKIPTFNQALKEHRRSNNVFDFLTNICYKASSMSNFPGNSGFKKKLITGLVTSVLAVGLCIGVNAPGYRLGYAVAIDGEEIGVVVKQEDVFYAIDSAKEHIEKNLFAEEAAKYKIEPEFRIRIVSAEEAINEKEIKNRILSGIGVMVECAGVFIDGKVYMGFTNKSDAVAALSRYKQQYANEDVTDDTVLEFCETVEIKDTFVNIDMIKEPDEAVEFLKNANKDMGEQAPLLSVKSIQTLELTESIPYETEKIEDPNLYINKIQVAAEGQSGEKKIFAKVTKVNGSEIEKEIMSQEVAREPIARVERIGTKELPKTTGSGSFARPTLGVLSSRYGSRWGRNHNGIDIAGEENASIYAADGGVVTYAGWMGGYGNYVIIDHENGYQTCYGHCNSLLVSAGDRVASGDKIALMGNTGNSTGTHLHFEVKKNGSFTDPLGYVNYTP